VPLQQHSIDYFPVFQLPFVQFMWHNIPSFKIFSITCKRSETVRWATRNFLASYFWDWYVLLVFEFRRTTWTFVVFYTKIVIFEAFKPMLIVILNWYMFAIGLKKYATDFCRSFFHNKIMYHHFPQMLFSWDKIWHA